MGGSRTGSEKENNSVESEKQTTEKAVMAVDAVDKDESKNQ